MSVAAVTCQAELLDNQPRDTLGLVLDDIDRAIEANTWHEIAYGRMQSACRGDKP